MDVPGYRLARHAMRDDSTMKSQKGLKNYRFFPNSSRNVVFFTLMANIQERTLE